MQIIADYTPEAISQEDDVLFLCCHALGRLKMIGSVIQEGCVTIHHPPMSGYRATEVGAMGAIVSDSAQEIEALIEIAQKRWQSERRNHAD